MGFNKWKGKKNRIDTSILETTDINAKIEGKQKVRFLASRLLLTSNIHNERCQISQKECSLLETKIKNLVKKTEQRKILYRILNLLLFEPKTKNKYRYYLFKMYKYFRGRKRRSLKKENIGLKKYYKDGLFNKRLTESIYIILRHNTQVAKK